MRPVRWIVRLGLFAVGFGVGLSHYDVPSATQPILIEIRVMSPDTNHTVPSSIPPATFMQPRLRTSCVELEHPLCHQDPMKWRL